MSKRKIPHPATAEEDLKICDAASADPDARELTHAELADFKPAGEVLPGILGTAGAAMLMKRRGRPALPVDERKVTLNMRADRDVVEAFKATGDGWQTRINDVLRAYATSHKMLRRS
ncbi:hypothetical protein LMG26411_01638 [Cupriavidus numazuensis]|uniref:BrnA antitoxin of type II toxin-antitoxin system n=2 Tax=Cupriavidus numazuensis TaxID=221992 RepID=A0ABM8TE74_9BURK|nr:BrnA antitoxin family protein [Cupriavidus numazuensis]CAG2138891.1 hypothetical protein LMG26411_01638 [Cupriavidus numazuensis]